MSITTYYTSDSHLSHAKILEYTRRPFADVEAMNAVLVAALRAVDDAGHRLIHGGDLGFNLRRFRQERGPLFLNDANRHNRIIVCGNHDQAKGGRRADYEAEFGTVVGHEKSWAENVRIVPDWLDDEPALVVVSHRPLDDDELDAYRQGWDGVCVNCFGHVHNDVLIPEYTTEWTPEFRERMQRGERHWNACVELHDYRPVTLEQLRDRQRELRTLFYPNEES